MSLMNTKRIATIGIISFIVLVGIVVLVLLTQGVIDKEVITAWLQSPVSDLAIYEFIIIIIIVNKVFGGK